MARNADKRLHDGNIKAEDWRKPAQIDADRVWYAPEFRRLEGVTQVVPPQDDYVFHDRLTHSVKVAQVAATLARRIIHIASNPDSPESRKLVANEIDINSWIDPEHCYVAGLAHDIGHPPYGHAGEAALQAIAARHGGDLSDRSFEGNAQSTHIVGTLSFRKPMIRGLDLTLRSLAAIAKYPWLRGRHPAHVDKLAKKWSFYAEEEHILQQLREEGFLVEVLDQDRVLAVHRWPEAEVMDWADDISYAVHDLEDFYRAGRIPLHRITTALENSPKHFLEGENATELWTTTNFYDVARNDDEVRSALIYARAKMLKALSDTGAPLAAHMPAAFIELCKVLCPKMPTNRFDGSRQAHTDLQRFASETITYLSNKTSIDVFEPHEGTPWVRFTVDPVARVVAEFFKSICQFYVIESSSLATMQFGQSLALERITDALVRMSVRWLEQRNSAVQQRSLPSRLVEYLKADAKLSDGSIREEIKAIQLSLDLEQDGDARDTMIKRREEILQIERGYIKICVFDYLCGLRDMQTAILDERLIGNRSSLSLANTWLDA